MSKPLEQNEPEAAVLDPDIERKRNERIGIAQAIIKAYTTELLNTPEVKTALLSYYLDGSETDRSELADGKLVFPKDRFIWESFIRKSDRRTELALTKYPPVGGKTSSEVEEMVRAEVPLDQYGAPSDAKVSYHHLFSYRISEKNKFYTKPH